MIMPKTEEKQKKQDLGIFYSPPAVANFIFEILTIWKNREDKKFARWQSRKPRPHFPSAVDPAVGEGVFLKTAVEKGFTEPDWIFGLDIDENAVRKWKEINMLKQFGGKEKDLDAHFFHQNGLEPIKWEQHISTYRYKLKQEDIKKQQFDAVVGNPPYGGLGVDLKNKKNPEAIALLNALKKYEIFWWKKVKQNGQNKAEVTLSLFKNFAQTETKNRFLGITEVAKIAEGIPIEILFTERFLQLAKPGGWVAIIVPDGILTNSNAHYVREFIANKAKVEAIVSLPRGTFKQAGTSAKTSILFLRKYKQDEQPHYNYNYPIFLSSVTAADEENFKKVVKEYAKFYNHNNSMNKSNHNNKIAIIKDESGKEAVMVRVDKTLKELMAEAPSSRWNVEYWRQEYLENLKVLQESGFEIATIGQYEERITYGAIVTGKKDYSGNDVLLINQGNISFTGLDLSDAKRIKEKSPWVIERAIVKDKTILIARSGVAGVGKNRITIAIKPPKAVVDSFVDILDVKNINPFYVVVFWKSIFGWLQVERFINGVGTVNISFDEIRAIKIPILPEKIQENIESEYKKMSAFHDKAMEAKKKGDEAGYKKNIETAERMLRDLISRTEAVIRGERKDVV